MRRVAVAGLLAVLALTACGGVGARSSGVLHYVLGGESAVWPDDSGAVAVDPAAGWSPDGAYRVEGTFYALTLTETASGSSQTVIEGATGQELIPESVVWSPDGAHFAFLQFELSGYQVGIVTLDGLNVQMLALPAGRVSGQIAWLDASRLAYSDLDKLYVYSLSDGSVLELGEGRQPLPSPDGTRLAFERVSAASPGGCATAVGMGIVSAGGGDWRVMLDEQGRFASVVGWSEGGAAVLVSSRVIDCNAEVAPQPDRLLRLDVETGAVETLSTAADGPWPLAQVAADPFSAQVAFVVGACDGQQSLVVSSVNHPDERQIVASYVGEGCAFSHLRWLP